MAEQLVARISTAASSWRRPAGSASETTSGAEDDSGFGSTGRRGTAADHDAASTVAMSRSAGVREDARRVPGAVGIVNHHNTCFINAVVQCLSNTPAFLVHALSPALPSASHARLAATSPDGELGTELSRLLRAMWTGRYSTDASRYGWRMIFFNEEII